VGGQLHAIILAAGQSRRFPANKLLRTLPSGECLLDRAVHNARRLSPQLLLVTNDDPDILSHCRDSAYDYVINPNATSGMASSIACGLRARADAGAWALFLADMPCIRASTLQALADSWPAHDVTLPTYHGQHGHPVIFKHNWFDALCSLQGDHGARDLLQGNPGVYRHETGDPGVCFDIDSEVDWQAYLDDQPC